jgi:hypothetical protein
MGDIRLIRLGGYFALLVAAIQLVGNGLHPPIPSDPVEALEIIHHTGHWAIIHIAVCISYFLFIPFVIGASAAFTDRRSPLVRTATPLVIVGAGIGAAQILTHLTLFSYLAEQYATADADGQQMIIFLYEAFWPYNVALEVAHLEAIFIAVILYGVALLNEDAFPRWQAWLGIGAGLVASAGILIGKAILDNDILFGVSLLPLIVWIVAIGITLLRLQPPESEPLPA